MFNKVLPRVGRYSNFQKLPLTENLACSYATWSVASTSFKTKLASSLSHRKVGRPMINTPETCSGAISPRLGTDDEWALILDRPRAHSCATTVIFESALDVRDPRIDTLNLAPPPPPKHLFAVCGKYAADKLASSESSIIESPLLGPEISRFKKFTTTTLELRGSLHVPRINLNRARVVHHLLKK